MTDRQLEAGSWKLEAGSWKLEAGSWKLEAGSWKLEAGSWKLEAGRKDDVVSQPRQTVPPPLTVDTPARRIH
jgi:uncharacterized cupin superfamily protein